MENATGLNCSCPSGRSIGAWITQSTSWHNPTPECCASFCISKDQKSRTGSHTNCDGCENRFTAVTYSPTIPGYGHKWWSISAMLSSTQWLKPRPTTNSPNSEWREDISTSTSQNLSDMLLWPAMVLTNPRSLINSSKAYPIPLPEPVLRWTHRIPGRNGRPQHANTKMYIYTGNRS